LSVAIERCQLHPERQAAVCCPSCRRFYCRECVTEHAGRYLCARCLRLANKPRARRQLPLALLRAPFTLLVGVVVGWGVFYLYAQLLALLVTAFQHGFLTGNS